MYSGGYIEQYRLKAMARVLFAGEESRFYNANIHVMMQ